MEMEATCSRGELQFSQGEAAAGTRVCLPQRSEEHVAQGRLLEVVLVHAMSE